MVRILNRKGAMMKKLSVVCCVLLMGFSGYTLADEGAVKKRSLTRGSSLISKSTQATSGMSIGLYLPLVDDAAYSSIMAAGQLTLTPNSTFNGVRAIRVVSYNTFDGTCPDDDVFGEYDIDNGLGNTVTLLAGHSYSTTDASNWALVQASYDGEESIFNPYYDSRFQLLDNDLQGMAATGCVGGSGDLTTCTGSTNCGWSNLEAQTIISP